MIVEAPPVVAENWTYDDIIQLEDDKRREIYFGFVYEMPSPSLSHQKVYLALLTSIIAWKAAGGHGLIYPQPVDLVVSDSLVFVPDLAYFATDDAASVERSDDRCLIAPPDLIVEIVSPSTESHDRVTKYRAYAEFGVCHYWIIDPEAQILHAFALREGHYAEEAVLKSDEEFRPNLFPGLVLSLDTLFQIGQLSK